jgi:hypothetical protein
VSAVILIVTFDSFAERAGADFITFGRKLTFLKSSARERRNASNTFI